MLRLGPDKVKITVTYEAHDAIWGDSTMRTLLSSASVLSCALYLWEHICYTFHFVVNSLWVWPALGITLFLGCETLVAQ